MRIPKLLAGTFSLAVLLAPGARAEEIVVRGQRTVHEFRALHPQSGALEQSEKANLKGATRVTVTGDATVQAQPVIDTATRAGANNVDNLQFTLRRDRPSRDQALTEATREALSKARVITQTLGGRVVRVVEVQEAGTARPPIIYARQEFSLATRADVATPIEVGTLDIKSQVQLIAEIEIRP